MKGRIEMSGKLETAARAAAKRRLDDLIEIEEILLSGENLKDVLLQGLVTAFEAGFVSGSLAP